MIMKDKSNEELMKMSFYIEYRYAEMKMAVDEFMKFVKDTYTEMSHRGLITSIPDSMKDPSSPNTDEMVNMDEMKKKFH